MVKHWNKLPKEVVDVSSQKTFKVGLDRALSNLLSLKMSLLLAGRLDWMAFKGHPIHSMPLSCHTSISFWKTPL